MAEQKEAVAATADAEAIVCVWPIYVHSPWFEALFRGDKLHEGRCNMRNSAKMQIGHILEIGLAKDNKRVITQATFQRKIKNILKFKSFEEALQTLPLQRVLPGVASVDDGVAIYHKYVSQENEQAHGVLMIELEPPTDKWQYPHLWLGGVCTTCGMQWQQKDAGLCRARGHRWQSSGISNESSEADWHRSAFQGCSACGCNRSSAEADLPCRKGGHDFTQCVDTYVWRCSVCNILSTHPAARFPSGAACHWTAERCREDFKR